MLYYKREIPARGDMDLRFTSFSEMLAHYADTTPEAPALCYEFDGALRTESYQKLSEAVSVRAMELRREGKTCLGLLADGSRACVVELFAAVEAGMQVVLLDESAPLPTLRGMLAYTDVDALWGGTGLCAELSPNLTGGVKDGAGRVLFFTSGTTERSKAVTLTEKSLCASAYNGGALLPLRPDDRLLCMLPLGHVFGFVCGLLWGLSCGACVALGRGVRHYIDDCAFFRPTAVSLVPSLLGFLLKNKLFNRELELVLIGAGDCPAQYLEAARAMDLRVSFGYGLTETSSGVALSLGDDPFAMTICPDDTVRIAADGEILIRAESCIMKGYYKCPEETNAALAGGELHTGDLGFLDHKGRLHVTGRKKDVLVLPDGTKIFLPECEAELSTLLGEGDYALMLKEGRVALAIYGDERSDEELLEAVASYQRLRPRGQQISLIARQSAPLPRTATGKLRRWALR